MEPLRRFIRRIRGIPPILSREDEEFASASGSEIEGEVPSRAGNFADDRMIQLEGPPDARFLIPIEYPPSLDYRPRWGYSRPPHPALSKLFARNELSYLRTIEEIRALKPLLARIDLKFRPEEHAEPGWIGGPMNALDLALLYHSIWKHQPQTYIEIGSGVSTYFVRRAVGDHNLRTWLVSIDPEPRAMIDGICDQALRIGLENLEDLSIFAALEPGDIVFLDGSHRSFMNSDVTVFFLDVLPILRRGVIIGIHDVLLPYDYPESFRKWHWNEQYLLGTYVLGCRGNVEILMPSHYMSRTKRLRKYLEPPILEIGTDATTWTEGGSLWFRHREDRR